MDAPDLDIESLLRRALQGVAPAVASLVERLLPVVQIRVSQTLLRLRPALAGADLRREVEDLTQEVMAYLFDGGARVLRSWRRDGGASLEGFVAMVAQRRVWAFVRNQTRNPWREQLGGDEQLARLATTAPTPDHIVSQQEFLEVLLRRLDERLSPRGRVLFRRLFIDEESVESVSASERLSEDAVYAWRSRLGQALRAVYHELADETEVPAPTATAAAAAARPRLKAVP